MYLLNIIWEVFDMAGVNTKDFCKMMKGEGTFLLDVQSPEDFAEAHVKDSFNIPAEDVADCTDDLPTDEKILVICKDGEAAPAVVETLKGKGFDAEYLEGGIEKGWKAFKLPTAHACAT
ncbi:MAG: rhodanese-like domain-containing protein [Synergistales bacterium]|nr:rhodanese-like domain-containing protein [Synergistales bacterium]